MMARFQRLRWIPMIMKAYNDARQQTEQTRDVSSTPPVDDRLPQDTSSRSQSTLRPQAKSRPIRPYRQVAAKAQQPRVPTRGAAIEPKRRPPNPSMIHGYQQVIRELRQTKDKLGQLEVANRALKERQAQIQSQLSRLLQTIQNQISPEATAPAEPAPQEESASSEN